MPVDKVVRCVEGDSDKVVALKCDTRVLAVLLGLAVMGSVPEKRILSCDWVDEAEDATSLTINGFAFDGVPKLVVTDSHVGCLCPCCCTDKSCQHGH